LYKYGSEFYGLESCLQITSAFAKRCKILQHGTRFYCVGTRYFWSNNLKGVPRLDLVLLSFAPMNSHRSSPERGGDGSANTSRTSPLLYISRLISVIIFLRNKKNARLQVKKEPGGSLRQPRKIEYDEVFPCGAARSERSLVCLFAR